MTAIIGNHKSFGPILLCQAATPERWEFSCPWCSGQHGHVSGPGPRASHCRHPDAPGQYYLTAAPNRPRGKK